MPKCQFKRVEFNIYDDPKLIEKLNSENKDPDEYAYLPSRLITNDLINKMIGADRVVVNYLATMDKDTIGNVIALFSYSVGYASGVSDQVIDTLFCPRPCCYRYEEEPEIDSEAFILGLHKCALNSHKQVLAYSKYIKMAKYFADAEMSLLTESLSVGIPHTCIYERLLTS